MNSISSIAVHVHLLASNLTVYTFGVQTPVRVIFHVIGVEKSNFSQLNVHPENWYPVFVGSSGISAFFSYSTFCHDIKLHPSVSKLTSYISLFQDKLTINPVAGIVAGVPAANPLNTCPGLFVDSGNGISAQYLTICVFG
jgi:hypothetical protein